MAEKIVNEIKEDFLTCKLCNRTFSHPKALPCLHTYCKSCIEQHITKHAIKAGDGTSCVFCPTCRQVCDIPRSGVDGLQDNHLLKNLLDSMHSHAPHRCDMCHDEGIKNDATYVCIRCEDFLCNDCSKSHKRTRITRDHLVMKISSMRDLYNSSQKTKHVTDIHVRQMARFGHYGENMYNPISVAVNTANDIVISNENNFISIFSIAGDCKKLIGQNVFYGLEKNCLSNKCASVTSEGYIAVAMRKDRTSSHAHVAVIESLANREVAVCSAKMSSPHNSIPHGIAVMSNNYTVVSDVGRHCMYIFDADYRLIKQFGKRGSRNSQFKYPYHITVSKHNDHILVSDYGNHCIKIFDNKGKFKSKFGSIGTDPDQFMHPVGLCCDVEDNVFVCDRDNHRVQMFNKTGEFLVYVIPNTCRDNMDIRPQDVALTTQRHLVVLLKGIEGVEFSQIHIYQYVAVGSSRGKPTSLDEETTQQLYMLRASIDSMNLLTGSPQRRSKRMLPPLVPPGGSGGHRGDSQQPHFGKSHHNYHPSAPPDIVPSDTGHVSDQDNGQSSQRPAHSKESSVCNIL